MKYIVKLDNEQQRSELIEFASKNGWKPNAFTKLYDAKMPIYTFCLGTHEICTRSDFIPPYQCEIKTISEIKQFLEMTTTTERNIMNPYKLLLVQNAKNETPASIITESTILARSKEEAKITLMQNHPQVPMADVTIYCSEF